MEHKTELMQSVQRSFAVLEWLSAHPEGAEVRQVAAALGLPKSTVHRILASLAGLGYVLQTGAGASYRPTLKMFEVASEVVGSIDVVSFARPHLDALAAETGETVHLVVRDGLDVVYVYKAESGGMRMSSRLGLRAPLYCTGVGKAILSALPWAEAQRLWQQSDVQPLTPHTITRFDALEKQLAAARRSGYAVDDEENELGIRCVAAALPGPVMAAFSVSGMAVRMDEQRLPALAARCLAAKAAILQDMGLRA